MKLFNLGDAVQLKDSEAYEGCSFRVTKTDTESVITLTDNGLVETGTTNYELNNGFMKDVAEERLKQPE